MLIPQLLIAIIDVDKYASLLIPHKLLIIYKELAYSLPHKTRLLKHRALQLQNKHKGKAEILQRQEAGRQACEVFSAGKGAGGCLGGSKHLQRAGTQLLYKPRAKSQGSIPGASSGKSRKSARTNNQAASTVRDFARQHPHPAFMRISHLQKSNMNHFPFKYVANGNQKGI